MVVFLVLFEVGCEHVDLFSQHSYLHLLAPGVSLVRLELLDDRLLFLR